MKTSRTRKPHPDHSACIARINRVKGQLDAVTRLIQGSEYCPKIIQQVRAAKNALHGVETEILKRHLRGCVTTALESPDAFKAGDKIEEIVNLFSK